MLTSKLDTKKEHLLYDIFKLVVACLYVFDSGMIRKV